MADANIILIGFMGCGKSSIGRNLARRMRYKFADTDAAIVRAAGKPITEIFDTDGEAHFRKLEAAALEKLAVEGRHVIATGGGIIVRPKNRELLQRSGFVVWLRATEEVIFERVSRNKRRPLLQTENPRKTVHDLLKARLPLYESAAQFAVDTSHRTHSQVADIVISEAAKRDLWQPPQ